MQFSLSGKLSLPRRVASSTIKIEIRAEIDVSPQAEKDYTTLFSINSYMELQIRLTPPSEARYLYTGRLGAGLLRGNVGLFLQLGTGDEAELSLEAELCGMGFFSLF